MTKHEIRLDLSGLDLGGLETDDDFRRAARRLLPDALEDLGGAMAAAAWARRGGGRLDREEFVAKAGRTYRRFAPVADRQALEDLLVHKLREAKAAGGTKDGGPTAHG